MTTAMERFETLGVPLTAPDEVRRLVQAGRTVWSYGYDTNDPDNFTTLEESDLDSLDEMWQAWQPFRVEPIVELLELEEDVFNPVCPADGEEYDRRTDLNHELHDSEHPNHHKFCDILYVGHYHDTVDGTLTAPLDDQDHEEWLKTVRFDPEQALDRLNSFISIFEGDTVTDTVTLYEATRTLGDLVYAYLESERDRLSHP